jgi:membrane-associated protease RseP (regulator of RpoE activity)
MKLPILKTTALAALLLLPTASRLAASGDPDPSPKPKVTKEKKIVVEVPDRQIVVGDDGVLVGGDFDFDFDFEPEDFADLRDLDDVPGFHGPWQGGGYIGVRPVSMTPELRTHFGAPKDAGVFVGKVENDSPAAKAGLQVGDILTAADGEKIESKGDLVRAVRRKSDGDTVKLDLIRDRSARSLSVTVAAREVDAEVRVGELGPRRFQFRRHAVPPVPPVPPVAPLPPGSPRLQKQIDDLEKRLDDLESRVPQKR